MKFSPEDLKTFCTRIMETAGLSNWESDVVADSLVEADMRGTGSHGVMRLRAYIQRLEAGVVVSNVTPNIMNDSPGALLVDGGNGMGISVGVQVMDQCIDRARTQGSCFAAVCRANHFGIGAYFTMHAARAGMIGLAMSNAPASVVPAGGRRAMLGTNPLSIAVPAAKHRPLVLDMASSVVAQGKVILAAKEGQPTIPNTWAVDECGRPTSDPVAALQGAMLPFGGPKGYAIALIIDILCSALSGSLSSTGIRSFWDNLQEPQNLGFFMGVWNVEQFLPLKMFTDRVDTMLSAIKACPPAPGFDEVRIPGELEFANYDEAAAEGIELGPATVEDLSSLGSQYSISFPLHNQY